MKKFFKWFAIILIGLIVIGMLLPSDEESNTGSKVGEADATEAEADVNDTIFKVGDVVDLNGVLLTVKDATYIPASEYSQPENGKVLQMNVEVVNNTEDSTFVDSSNFNLYDADGNALDFYYGLDGLDISGDLNKGKKLQGTLTFDVPEGSNYEMIFEPTFSWTDESITWDIQPN
ncbi:MULTISPECIES: DUF4352 domain-containing protein [Exiguobacterium]|uniref:DUF4352 domain-containing protein n=1 Tax=Exiguobacterium sp. (strain ATCC BAA-1283 / AT1b) TaxID=360911 RepID=C4L5P0_EXISA|nr:MULTISPECIES: DUF4352 domain-containing protein [Exiguobacterium]ACQ69855.1 hypothetical protein EAT1b_0926 [Exiguobacterium sp. AT1b]MCC9622203.1 DUF4352 domain-containing protein [Thalassospira sp. MA62]MDX5980139.1 DUF4352 domain-containing protein [Exiguobacterium profundum]QUP87920.1 DUF4352 domain-containing protein [Exiguobacterium sp. PFWT01]